MDEMNEAEIRWQVEALQRRLDLIAVRQDRLLSAGGIMECLIMPYLASVAAVACISPAAMYWWAVIGAGAMAVGFAGLAAALAITKGWRHGLEQDIDRLATK